MKVKHILVPTDGSELSIKAAAAAGDLARALSARVTVITVLDEQSVIPIAWTGAAIGAGAVATDTTDFSVETVRADLEKKARENTLAPTVTQIGEVSSVTQDISWGHTATKVIEYASDNDIDLVVMGSHGRSGVKAALLGSVSHAVVNRAPCPVMVIR